MAAANPAYDMDANGASRHLFDAIGAFLSEHKLSPDPRHYAFAYRVVSEPDGPVAQSVRILTEGAVRLCARDIDALGGEIGDATPAAAAGRSAAATDGLVARTQMQVEEFVDLISAMRSEAQGFGRDLAAGAQAIDSADAVDDVARIAAAMLDRVRQTEARLDAATHEATELRTKLEEARGDARRDPLTDLPNRRAFEEAFEAQTASGAASCLAICDIDHFKAVNDRFGHSVGDRVLKAIAEVLGQACDGHLVARHGGEEFVVLFRGVDAAAASTTLERARGAVAAKRYRLRESDEPIGSVTFSAGLTSIGEGELLGTVFGRADKLLFAAKHAGRNLLRAA